MMRFITFSTMALLVAPSVCFGLGGGMGYTPDVSGSISTHNSDTTAVHGIADTSVLVDRLPICKIITNPNDADAFMFAANQSGAAWTVNEVRGVALGGTSVIFTLQECDANGANCAQINDAKTISTGTAGTGTITNASVDDNDVIKIDIGTVTGAVTQLMVCAEVQ